MKKIALSILLIGLISCASALKRDDVNTWLAVKANNIPPEINISGEWHDAHSDFKGPRFMPFSWGQGWGQGFLRQTSNRVTGQIGSYNIKGIVSGNTVYLVFLSGGYVYYTSCLKLSKNKILYGNYFYPKDKEQKYGYVMSLKKILCADFL